MLLRPHLDCAEPALSSTLLTTLNTSLTHETWDHDHHQISIMWSRWSWSRWYHHHSTKQMTSGHRNPLNPQFKSYYFVWIVFLLPHFIMNCEAGTQSVNMRVAGTWPWSSAELCQYMTILTNQTNWSRTTCQTLTERWHTSTKQQHFKFQTQDFL